MHCLYENKYSFVHFYSSSRFEMAKVLLIGGGGREHALSWKLLKFNTVSHVFVAPGNAGTDNQTNTTNVSK